MVRNVLGVLEDSISGILDGGVNSFVSKSNFLEFLFQLKSFESMTWNEIKKATGGRNHGNNNHEVPISKICSDAQKRLVELHLDDEDTLYSLRLGSRERLWGIKEGSCLDLLWHDLNHEVYPISD